MPLESNINGLWVAKQTGKGAPVTMTSGTKRGRWVGGDMQSNRADGSENWSDGTLFGDVVDFANTLIGNGAPVLQGQSGLIAYLNWLAAGQETVSPTSQNAVITVTVTGAPTGGSFTLTFVVAGGPFAGTWITAPIVWNATGAQVATAVSALAPFAAAVTAGGTITGGGGPLPGTAVTLTFAGTTLANQPMILPTAVSTGFTGGASPTATPTMTTVGRGSTHVATPNDAGGFWSTWVKSVGKTVVHRSQFNDCRIQSLRWEGSSASKVVKITPTFMSLDPGVIVAADPTGIDDATVPFIYTESQGAFNIDGTVYNGHSSFAATAQWGIQEWYGDDVSPFDVVNARATLTVDGITILLDTAGLTRYNNQIYGKSSPVAGDKPMKGIPALGSYSANFQKRNPYTWLVRESFLFEIPGVKWNPDLNIPASPDGGPVELALAGEFRKVAGQPAWRATVVNGDVAYTT